MVVMTYNYKLLFQYHTTNIWVHPGTHCDMQVTTGNIKVKEWHTHECILVMQRFRVVFRGISRKSLVSFRCTHEP